MLVRFSPGLEHSCECSIQLYLCAMSHLYGICPTQCWWEVWLTLISNDNKHSMVAKEIPNIKSMNNVGVSNKSPIHLMVVRHGTIYSTGSWRPAPSTERVPSWSDHRAGSSPGFQTSWLTRRAQPHEAWCRGYRWSSWRRCTAREGWNGANQVKRERTQRRQTCYCLLGQTKELSVRWVSLTELRLLCRLSDKLARLDLCCVFMFWGECMNLYASVGVLVYWQRLGFPWNARHAGEPVLAVSRALTQRQKGDLWGI